MRKNCTDWTVEGLLQGVRGSLQFKEADSSPAPGLRTSAYRCDLDNCSQPSDPERGATFLDGVGRDGGARSVTAWGSGLDNSRWT